MRARLFIGLVLLFGALLVIGTIPRLQRQKELRAEVQTRTEAVVVRVMPVRLGGTSSEFTLPGTVQPMRETPVYARTSGFVRRWLVDIGATVRSGQLLAELETPDMDQELAQAKASLLRSRSAETLTRTTLERMRALVRDSAATRQELDEKDAAFQASQASVAAEEANVRRLEELQRFGRVTAPFSGMITARNLELGGLVTSGTAGASAKPLFVISQSDTVRVFVNVPENAATVIRPAIEAGVSVRDLPGRTFIGRVSRTSGTLDPATRTMIAQVDVPNIGNALLPGMYAQVKLAAKQKVAAVLVPANALVVRAEGPQVATVDNGKIHFVTLQLGRDLGTELEVVSGVRGGEQVVINPSDDVVEGTPVRVVVAESATKEGEAKDAKKSAIVPAAPAAQEKKASEKH